MRVKQEKISPDPSQTGVRTLFLKVKKKKGRKKGRERKEASRQAELLHAN